MIIDIAWMSAAAIAAMIIIGVFVRRVLGVRVGTVRVILAGLVGLGAEIGFEARVVWPGGEYTPALIPVQLSIILLAAVAFLVIVDIAIPQGTITRIDQWIPGIRRTAGRARRYSQLMKLAFRYKLIPFKLDTAPTTVASQERRRQAIALKAALEEAGGAFIKLGQILSTRTDILPAEFIDELGTLQQRVPAESWERIRTVLSEELDGPIEEYFSSFDREPVASASIGQVHRATLVTGEHVAVKLQRPGIIPLVERDVEITRRLAARLTQSAAWARQFGVEDVAESIAASLLDELDYRVEASNLTALTAAQSTHPEDEHLRLPRLFEDVSSRRILVMEFLDGATLSDPTAAARLDSETRSALAQQLLAAVLGQIMDDGVFHSDLHPGNVMITPQNRLALLDFGSVGRLDSQVRRQITNLLMAVTHNDAVAFADALLAFVEIPDDLDEPALRRDIGQFMARYLGPGAALDAAAFSRVISVLGAYKLAVPPQLTVAARAIGTVEGTLRVLSFDFDFVTGSADYAQQRIKEARAPQAVFRAGVDELTRLLPVARELPHQVGRIAQSLAEGRMSVNIRLLADRRERTVMRRFVNLAAVTFLAGVFGIMATMFLISSGGPQVSPTLGLYDVFGYLLVFASGVLTFRAVFDIFGRDRE
ncbi:ABC1 kinase family protein [Microbacterium sp. 22242]|uniref:ABC1 kinase family protein n=1 Tax=Microbacterium sp. 22242 TaxID=3453896 RepID=UPI003F87CE2D